MADPVPSQIQTTSPHLSHQLRNESSSSLAEVKTAEVKTAEEHRVKSRSSSSLKEFIFGSPATLPKRGRSSTVGETMSRASFISTPPVIPSSKITSAADSNSTPHPSNSEPTQNPFSASVVPIKSNTPSENIQSSTPDNESPLPSKVPVIVSLPKYSGANFASQKATPTSAVTQPFTRIASSDKLYQYNSLQQTDDESDYLEKSGSVSVSESCDTDMVMNTDELPNPDDLPLNSAFPTLSVGPPSSLSLSALNLSTNSLPDQIPCTPGNLTNPTNAVVGGLATSNEASTSTYPPSSPSSASSSAALVTSKEKEHRRASRLRTETALSGSDISDVPTPNEKLDPNWEVNIRRMQHFNTLFPNLLSNDELLRADFGCALQKEILLQGRLYLTKKNICFYSNIFGWITQLIIPFQEVIAIEKKMTAFFIPNALEITTINNKYFLSSFLYREQAYNVLIDCWQQKWKALSEDLSRDPLSAQLNEASQRLEFISKSGMVFEGDTDQEKSTGGFDIDDSFLMSSVSSSNIVRLARETILALGSKSSKEDLAGNKIAPPLPKRQANIPDKENENLSVEPLLKNAEKSSSEVVQGAEEKFGGKPEIKFIQSCACNKHLENMVAQRVIHGMNLPEVVMLLFQLGDTNDSISTETAKYKFYRNFLAEHNDSSEIQISPWTLSAKNNQLERSLSYVILLKQALGPKSTKCIVQQTVTTKTNNCVVVDSTVRTPDIPSGSSFHVMVKSCFAWSAEKEVKMIVTMGMIWTGRSFIKGAIERGVIEGNKKHYTILADVLVQEAKRDLVICQDKMLEGAHADVLEVSTQHKETSVQEEIEFSDFVRSPEVTSTSQQYNSQQKTIFDGIIDMAMALASKFFTVPTFILLALIYIIITINSMNSRLIQVETLISPKHSIAQYQKWNLNETPVLKQKYSKSRITHRSTLGRYFNQKTKCPSISFGSILSIMVDKDANEWTNLRDRERRNYQSSLILELLEEFNGVSEDF